MCWADRRWASARRLLIAIRLDLDVLESFRKEARRAHWASDLINEVLARHARKDVA